MEDIKESILPILYTQTKLKAVALSPFTWNNIKLPAFQSVRNIEKQTINDSSQIKKEPLITIKEKIKTKSKIASLNKQEINTSIKQKTAYNKSKSIHEEASVLTEQDHKNNKNRRYVKNRGISEKLNKTIQVSKLQQNSKHVQQQTKKIKFLDDKNNMEHYLKMNLNKAGWKGDTKLQTKDAKLLWSNIDKISDHNYLKKGQFYNHLNGSYYITNKDKLHQEISIHGKDFYPKSFLIPKEYDTFAKTNNVIAALEMLKIISREILTFTSGSIILGELMQVTLGQILQSSIVKSNNEESSILIKLCMYLQLIRKEQNYIGYFQQFNSYLTVNIKPKTNLFDQLIEKAIHYLESNTTQYIQFDYSNIDYRLLLLIVHYHTLFARWDSVYNQQHHLWIVKPIASSRGAGMSVVKSSGQFCSASQISWSEFKNRRKYQNKIIQLYICNPYLLQQPKQFINRKFDIRQWVLVISKNNKPVIYKYHTGYCRFSSQKFNPLKLSKQIHLTNYSLFRQQSGTQSTLMLEDLFSFSPEDLRSKYNQQSSHIITETIINCSHIKYQQGCFQLFGFDFLIDSTGKMYLLQVNLNPACNSQRHSKLKAETQTMSKSMIALVTESVCSQNWIQIYGKEDNTVESFQTLCQGEQQLQIKPFYQYELNPKDSLIALIRIRQKIITRMGSILDRYPIRLSFQQIHNFNNNQPIQNHSQELQQNSNLICKTEQQQMNNPIRFIEQKSTSNF